VFGFRGASPRLPDQGLCSWTPLGAQPLDPRYGLVLRAHHMGLYGPQSLLLDPSLSQSEDLCGRMWLLNFSYIANSIGWVWPSYQFCCDLVSSYYCCYWFYLLLFFSKETITFDQSSCFKMAGRWLLVVKPVSFQYGI